MRTARGRGANRARWGRRGRGLRCVAVACAATLVVGVGIPLDGMPSGGFPVSWLWSWLDQDSALAASFLGLPVQPSGTAAGKDHHVSSGATRANGGAGRAPGRGIGALPPDTAPVSLVPKQTTDPIPGHDGFDPKTSKRIASAASETSDVYVNADGSYTRKVYESKINYKAADGTWRPIDRTLVRDGNGRLRQRANSVDLSLAGRAADERFAAIRLDAGHAISYSLLDAADTAAQLSGETATYPGVMPGVDVRLSANPAGLKESLVLHSADAPTSYVFPLRLQGLTPKRESDGSVTFRDSGGAVRATIPAGYMEDSHFDTRSGDFTRSSGVSYELTTWHGSPALRLSIDETWLRDPARVFPVTVDPTTNFADTGDTYARNDWPGTHGGSDELLVGTYNGGTSKAYSFMHFSGFGSTYGGAQMSTVRLHIFDSWASTCTAEPFWVNPITQSWTNKSVDSYPGPSFGSAIGSVTADPGKACTNTSGDRSIGTWMVVPLSLGTFKNWALGGTNNGLAVTASQTNSLQWKRFTSRNGPAGKGPYLRVTYTPGVKPQVDRQYPPTGYETPTLTPELLVAAHDPDAYPKALTYDFIVYDDAGTKIAESGWISSRKWTVPAGKLTWGQHYSWTVGASDSYYTSSSQRLNYFSTPVPQPLITSGLALNSGHGFEPSVGNYTTSDTDATVATVGPALTVERAYNSQDPRATSAFGAGWSSLFDARATEDTDPAGALRRVVVTYPGGQDVAFGRNSDGTFAPPPGRYANLKPVTGGYQLVDKDGTTYAFTTATGTSGQFALTTITDPQGRTERFTYNGSQLTTVTSASGRALHLTWSTPSGATAPHVATVATDPATAGDATTALTWAYGYSGDLLTKVCPPTSSTACTTYAYGTASRYPTAVQNAAPQSYWRLGDGSGTAATSAVLKNQGTDNGTYTDVTLGQSGPLPGSTVPAVSLNGTSSRVELPSKLVTAASYQAVSLWFKTTTAAGVLFSYQASAITNASTVGNYTPSLYVGSSGKLLGQFWDDNIGPITSANPVTDGKWHNVVLSAAGNNQAMYLDGALVGTKSGLIQMINAASAAHVYVGAGFIGGAWPDEPHMGQSGDTGYANFFNGSVGEVSFFDRPLTDSTVADLYHIGVAAARPLTSVTRPSGNASAKVAYDPVSGAVSQVTDPGGGVWKLSKPVVSGSSQAYVGAVLGGDPSDYWRLAESGTTDAINEVNGGIATYNLVTLGVDGGPFDDATVASFDGSSSYLRLPAADVPTTGPMSIGMWFKMPSGSTAGGVLYSYQAAPIEDPTVSGNWTPALYVGTDGKLRGGLWTGSADPMTSTTRVNDGKWHHVVLAANPSSQALYLDGKQIVTLAKAVVTTNAQYAFVGAGKWSTGWEGSDPATSPVGYFPGQISEVAYYRSQLSAEQVSNQYAALAKSAGAEVRTVTITDPGNHTITHVYDATNGRELAETDALGNKTQYGYDVRGFLRTVTDPNGNVTTTEHDVRGNVVSETTCQDRSANKCSTVYYTYYPDATTEELTPDPRNDVLLTMRDGRSASATDNSYLTTYSYDSYGNRTSVTDPLGRVTSTAYTDGTTVAAADGGYAPAGLPMTVKTPGGAVQSVTYFSNGDVAKVTDPAGKVTTFTYDALGRVLSEKEITSTFPGGLVTSYRYDGLGRVVSQTDPAVTDRVTGVTHTPVTTTTYDADGLVTSQTVSDTTGGDTSRTESATYDSHGRQVTKTDSAGKVSRYAYDVYGNLVKETEPDGGVTTSTYDAEGNLLTTTVVGYTGDPNNPSTATDVVMESNAYDPAGRLASETDAMGGVTSYTYTDNGLVATVTRSDPDTGQSFVVQSNTYDAAGNLIRRVSNDGATTMATTVDAAGRTTSSTLDPGGLDRKSTFAYSRDDDLVQTTLSDSSGTLSRSEAMYDPMGNTIAETRHLVDMAPVGRWRLNETAGTRAADSAGNSAATATDVTWSTEHGGSASFNGTTSHLATAGPVLDTARSFTVSAWVKPTDASRNRAVLAQEGNSESGFYLKLDHNAGDKWSFVMYNYDDSASPNTYATSGSTVALNTWTHLAAVYDASSEQVRLYVNGALSVTKALKADHVPWTSYGPLTIGRLKYHGNPTDHWAGSISDAQVYSQALTGSQVAGIYGGTAPAADAGVVRTSYDLDEDGLATAETDPNGQVTNYEYDADGERVVTRSPTVSTETGGGTPSATRPTTYAGYNTFGEQVEFKDANGNVTVTDYDAAGQVSAVHQPSYTPPGPSTPINPVTTYAYDDDGQLVAETDPLNRTTSYTYDQLGRLAKVTAPNQGVTTYTYDLLGDQLSVTDPNGAVQRATYDYLGRPLTSTDVVRQSGNFTTTYAYGTGGWLSQVTSPAGVVTKSTYNAAGEQITSTDGANNVTTYDYDGAGRLTRTTLPDGTSTAIVYDMAGRDAARKTYDALGGLLTTETVGYDRAGNVVSSTDPRGSTVRFSYDATGMLVKEVQPVSATDAITTTFGYDPGGNMTRFTDGRGNAFITTYNSWDLPESRVEPATAAYPNAADRTFTNVYDAAGRVASQSQPGGVSVTNTYDAMDNLVKQVGSGAEVATVDRTFGYDVGGRMTSMSAPGGTDTFSYDDRDQLVSTSGPSGSASFAYNADGRLTARTDAAGTTNYGYDSAGRVSKVSNPTANVQLSYAYDKLSQVTNVTYGSSGNRRTFSYDALHRPVVDELSTPAGSTIAKITYGYDANDNETSKVTTGFAGSTTNTYTYDLADRLTSWNDGTSTTQYAYDKSGNRTQAGDKVFTYDERNQLVTGAGSSYHYTARGTLSSTVTGSVTAVTEADAFGQILTQAGEGGTSTYTYDALGRLMRSGFAYSGLGNTLAADGTATYTRDVDDDLVGVASGSTTTLAWTDVHTDVVGQFTDTGTALAGSTTYDPLGAVVQSAGMLGHLGYQSEWTDFATGRVNMWARWYNTATGQFDTRDTEDVSPTPDSVSANRFAYADDNPLTMTDPTGHWGLGSLWHKATHAVSHAYHSAKRHVSHAYHKVRHAVRHVYHKVRHAVRHVYHRVKHAVRHVYHSVKRHVSHAYHAVRHYVSHAYHKAKRFVRHTYHRAKHWVKKRYHAAKRWVKHTYHKAKRWVAHKVHQVKRAAKHVYHKVKQAGRKVITKASRAARRVGSAVKDAYNATERWVKDHKNAIIEAAAIGGAVLAGIACTAATAGAGAVACMVGAAAVINLAKDAAEGKIHNWGDALGSAAVGGLQGLGGGVGGAIGGKIAGAVAGKLGRYAASLGGRVLAGATGGGVSDTVDQLVRTGHVNVRGVAAGVAMGAVFGGAARVSHAAVSSRFQGGSLPAAVSPYKLRAATAAKQEDDFRWYDGVATIKRDLDGRASRVQWEKGVAEVTASVARATGHELPLPKHVDGLDPTTGVCIAVAVICDVSVRSVKRLLNRN